MAGAAGDVFHGLREVTGADVFNCPAQSGIGGLVGLIGDFAFDRANLAVVRAATGKLAARMAIPTLTDLVAWHPNPPEGKSPKDAHAVAWAGSTTSGHGFLVWEPDAGDVESPKSRQAWNCIPEEVAAWARTEWVRFARNRGDKSKVGGSGGRPRSILPAVRLPGTGSVDPADVGNRNTPDAAG